MKYTVAALGVCAAVFSGQVLADDLQELTVADTRQIKQGPVCRDGNIAGSEAMFNALGRLVRICGQSTTVINGPPRSADPSSIIYAQYLFRRSMLPRRLSGESTGANILRGIGGIIYDSLERKQERRAYRASRGL